MSEPAAEILQGNVRDEIDFAVDRGLTKREIIRVLRECIEDVRDDPEIPE